MRARRPEGVERSRALPVGRVLGETLTLSAEHCWSLLGMSASMPAAGLLLLGLGVLLGAEGAWAVALTLAIWLAMAVLLAGFSVKVHRLLLEPADRWGRPPARGRTRRYLGAMGLLAVASLPAWALARMAVLALDQQGLPAPLGAILSLLLPFFAVQAVMARRVLLYLPGVSLGRRSPWAAATTMGRGAGRQLLCLNVCGGLYTVGVSLFAGWLVGAAFPRGPQDMLELMTLLVGLPAQAVFIVCLQAACYRRLTLDPEA